MSNNQFDLLGDDSLVKHLDKKKKSNTARKQQPVALFQSGNDEKRKRASRRAEFETIYDIEYLWFIVLEFLPVKDLFRCSMVNTYTNILVHSYNCYGEILKRDFFTKYENETKEMAKIMRNIDNTGVFAYLVRDCIGKAKLNPNKLETIRNTIQEMPDFKQKKIFGKMYKAIEDDVKSRLEEDELREQHIRRFLIEKLSKHGSQNMKSKVKECSHNHCTISEITNPTYHFKLECLDCNLTAFSNFRPESIFRSSTPVRRYGVVRVITTSANFERYPLSQDRADVYEFDITTVYQ